MCVNCKTTTQFIATHNVVQCPVRTVKNAYSATSKTKHMGRTRSCSAFASQYRTSRK